MDRARMLMVPRAEAARLHSGPVRARGSSKSFGLAPCGGAAPAQAARPDPASIHLTVTRLGDSLQIPLQPLQPSAIHPACSHSACRKPLI